MFSTANCTHGCHFVELRKIVLVRCYTHTQERGREEHRPATSGAEYRTLVANLQPPRSSSMTSGVSFGQSTGNPPLSPAPRSRPVALPSPGRLNPSKGEHPWRLCGTPYTRRPLSVPPTCFPPLTCAESDPKRAGARAIKPRPDALLPPSVLLLLLLLLPKRARSDAGCSTRRATPTAPRLLAGKADLLASPSPTAASEAEAEEADTGGPSRTIQTKGMGSSQRPTAHVARLLLPALPLAMSLYLLSRQHARKSGEYKNGTQAKGGAAVRSGEHDERRAHGQHSARKGQGARTQARARSRSPCRHCGRQCGRPCWAGPKPSVST